MFFWNSLAFLMMQQMLAIWSLVPLPFLNPAWTSQSSWFMYCWSLAWRIWGIFFASVWDEFNCVVVWTFFGMPFFGIGMKTDLFQFCGHCWVFQICWHIECNSFTASSFRIWSSSTGIPSVPLASKVEDKVWSILRYSQIGCSWQFCMWAFLSSYEITNSWLQSWN